MRSKQSGFTLIELVVVIVVLGILAAIAVPKFINVESEARTSAVRGMEAALHSTTLLARAKYKAVNNAAATTVDMDGTSVNVTAGTGSNAGKPEATAAGITAALESISGFTASYTTGPNVATYAPSGAPANCQVTYNDSGSITVTTTGC